MSGPEAPRPAVTPPEPVGVVDKLIQRGENANLTDDELRAPSIDQALATVRTRSAADRLHLRDAIDAWKRRNVQRQNVHAELDRLKAGTQVEGGSAFVVRAQDAAANQIDALRDSRASSTDKVRAFASILGPLAALGGGIGAFLARKSQRPVTEEVQDPAHPNDPTKKIRRPKMEDDPERPGQKRQVMENTGLGKILAAIGLAGAATTMAAWGSAVAVAREQRDQNVKEGPIPAARPRTPAPAPTPRPGGGPPPPRR